MKLSKNFYSSKVGLCPTLVVFSTLSYLTLFSVTFFFEMYYKKFLEKSNW